MRMQMRMQMYSVYTHTHTCMHALDWILLSDLGDITVVMSRLMVARSRVANMLIDHRSITNFQYNVQYNVQYGIWKSSLL